MAASERTNLRFFVRTIFYVVLGWFALFFNPFGISDRTDQATQDAVYRVLGPTYDTAARDDLLVVLLDDNAIRDLHEWGVFDANEWPLRYRDHAYLLSRVLGLEPRALFVDVYFKQERSTDDSFPLMESRLRRAVDAKDVPLFFAEGYAGEVRSSLQVRLNQLGPDPRGGGLVVNGWEGYGRAYPLNDNGYLTAAYRLYEVACLGDSPLRGCLGPALHREDLEPGQALSVNWGSRPPRALFPEYQSGTCDHEGQSVGMALWHLVTGLLQGLAPESWIQTAARQECPFHAVVFANHLVSLLRSPDPADRARLERLFYDKVVLYGVSLEGLHDRVRSPVHGQIPGVFLHAMTLDNLMLRGERYIKATDDMADRLAMGFWVLLAIGFAGAHRLIDTRKADLESCAREQRIAGGSGGAGALCRRVVAVILEHPKLTVFLSGAGLVVAASVGFFVLMDYEPINSIGFLGVLGVLSVVRDSELERRVLGWLQRTVGGKAGDAVGEL